MPSPDGNGHASAPGTVPITGGAGFVGSHLADELLGYHQDGPRQVDMQQWNWRGLDVINAHERDPAVVARGLQEAMVAVADGVLDPFPLITHSVPLAELGRAFGLMRERPDGFMKAVVVP